jgi:hypothetical protein
MIRCVHEVGWLVLQGTHKLACSNVHKVVIPGNPLVPEVPDTAAFAVFTVHRTSITT